MTVSARTSITGSARLAGGLHRMQALGVSPRPLWAALGQYGETSTRQRFESGIGPDGSRWKVSRRVKKHGGQTLKLTTRLLRSITHKASNTGAEWGSNVAYARIHQLGGKIERLAFSSTLRLRTGAGGRLLRQKDYAHLAVFAKATHKRVVERRYTVGAHTINMPARPYLGVNAEDAAEMRRLAGQVVGMAVRGEI